MKEQKKETPVFFSGTIGFVLSAAGYAIGLGNIWRFPYLAARNGGGLFLIIYLILAATFGRALLTTDLAIGRKTGTDALAAFGKVRKGWGFTGILSFAAALLVFGYYQVIGGWVLRYFVEYCLGNSTKLVEPAFFEQSVHTGTGAVIGAVFFLFLTLLIAGNDKENGVERFFKRAMPLLFVMILGISLFVLTLSHTGSEGQTRTGLEGLNYLFSFHLEGMTIHRFFQIILDAMGQLFFSLGVAMGVMITYGARVRKEENLYKAVWQIDFFDTLVAVLSAVMMIPAVYIFLDIEQMQSGQNLLFLSMPYVFSSMGNIGQMAGILFFLMVSIAALTTSVSLLEAVTANLRVLFPISGKMPRLIACLLAAVLAMITCWGDNLSYLDFFCSSMLMPMVCFFTCILIGWMKKPSWVLEEVEKGAPRVRGRRLYTVLIRYIIPGVMIYLMAESVVTFYFT